MKPSKCSFSKKLDPFGRNSDKKKIVLSLSGSVTLTYELHTQWKREKERENDINQNIYYSTQEQQSIKITDVHIHTVCMHVEMS